MCNGCDDCWIDFRDTPTIPQTSCSVSGNEFCGRVLAHAMTSRWAVTHNPCTSENHTHASHTQAVRHEFIVTAYVDVTCVLTRDLSPFSSESTSTPAVQTVAPQFISPL
jgi:hypothetical protein